MRPEGTVEMSQRQDKEMRKNVVLGHGEDEKGRTFYRNGVKMAGEWRNEGFGITLKNLHFILRTMGDTELKMVP